MDSILLKIKMKEISNSNNVFLATNLSHPYCLKN